MGEGGKKFKNLLATPQTIGFDERTVTWKPFEVEGLSPIEYNAPVFKRRAKDFKEVV